MRDDNSSFSVQINHKVYGAFQRCPRRFRICVHDMDLKLSVGTQFDWLVRGRRYDALAEDPSKCHCAVIGSPLRSHTL